jgi:uncharacterized membrane protein
MKNWILLVFYALIMGFQIFCAKIISTQKGWATGLTLVWGTAFLILCVFVFPRADFKFQPVYLIGIFAGILAGAGTVVYYYVLQKTEATKVFPAMALMIAVGMILSFIFLKENLGVKKIIGCCMSVAALVLVSL